MTNAKSTKSSSPYENARVAVDIVVFSILESKLQVFLHKREKSPFKGDSELIGGLLLPKESAEETVQRKLKSTLQTECDFISQFHTFSEPKRDPRGRTISIAHLALLRPSQVENPEFWRPAHSSLTLAFDHSGILKKALEYVSNLDERTIGKYLLASKFTMNELQATLEVVRNVEYDNRNFRKRMNALDVVRPTQSYTKNVSHRPARLYRIK